MIEPVLAVTGILSDVCTELSWFPSLDSGGLNLNGATVPDGKGNPDALQKESLPGRRRQPIEVLCLGLGSPTNSQNANAQLAFLLEACQHLDIPSDRISLYDPVFTEEDTNLFNHLGLSVQTRNRVRSAAGRHELRVPTLCFMLHCDLELYNALIEANCTSMDGNLANLVLIGNRLTEYIDRRAFFSPPPNPSEKLKSSVPYLFRIAPRLQSHPLSASRLYPTAFNNTCVQYYPRLEFPPLLDGGTTCAGTDYDGNNTAIVSGGGGEGNDDDNAQASQVSESSKVVAEASEALAKLAIGDDA
ncbi:hypothetical protein FA15DRAFT_586399 [Coprinopsis marcescibilis]|uniref:SRR1-like domain-containing protein n=1 Tax=Coprinopsis marcescibilis TaxID=230819 RepID=A0A5C3L5G0_COPMA|nr:hypothetical protein FA15DRAFT_586399 [Coprinopsis marcescibilis]